MKPMQVYMWILQRDTWPDGTLSAQFTGSCPKTLSTTGTQSKASTLLRLLHLIRSLHYRRIEKRPSQKAIVGGKILTAARPRLMRLTKPDGIKEPPEQSIQEKLGRVLATCLVILKARSSHGSCTADKQGPESKDTATQHEGMRMPTCPGACTWGKGRLYMHKADCSFLIL